MNDLKNENDLLGRGLTALIVIAAVVPRVVSLAVRPFSTAEAAVVMQARRPARELFEIILHHGEKYFPFDFRYAILLRVWHRIGGDGELWLRLPSLAFGLLGIYVAWRAARLLLDRNPALLAALIIAASPYHVMFSSNAGGDALVFLLCAAAMCTFIRIYLGQARAVDFSLFSLCLAAAVILRFEIAVMLLPCLILFFGFRGKSPGDVGRWLAALVLPAVALALWYALGRDVLTAVLFKPQTTSLFELFDARLLGKDALFHIAFLQSYLKTFMILSGFYGENYVKSNIILLPALVLTPIVYHLVVILGFREYEGGLRQRALCFFMLGLVGLAGAVSGAMGRFAHITLIPAYIIFACLVSGGVFRFASPRLRWVFAATLFCLALGGYSTVQRKEHKDPDWRGTARKIAESKDTAPVIAADGARSPAFMFYAKKYHLHAESIFPDFAPYMLDNGMFLQEYITAPFAPHFDTSETYFQNKLKTNGAAWLVYFEEEEPPPHVRVYLRWCKAAAENGILTIRPNMFPGDVTADRITLIGDPAGIELW